MKQEECMKTGSGTYWVFRGRDATNQGNYQPDSWYFDTYAERAYGDSVYSDPYPTQQAALDAAEAWEAEQADFEEDSLSEAVPSKPSSP